MAVFLVVGGCSQKVEQKIDVSYNLINMTDSNWVKGIATTHFLGTGFIINYSTQATSDFAIGNKVTFSDGTVRTIVKQLKYGNALIVFLDGTRLDGNLVGYPNTIKVTASRSK
jgi:endoglucanase